MKQQVLKALANPSHLFYVPYSLAVLNFAVWFLLYMGGFLITLFFSENNEPMPPYLFIIVLLATHSLLILVSKKDPQLGQIVVAKVNLFKRKIRPFSIE